MCWHKQRQYKLKMCSRSQLLRCSQSLWKGPVLLQRKYHRGRKKRLPKVRCKQCESNVSKLICRPWLSEHTPEPESRYRTILNSECGTY